jgi:methionine-rich copper-binding protein CopC
MRFASALGVVVWMVTLVSGSAPASAHARLARAEPSPSATLARAPTEVRIWTTQELTLSGNAVVVTDTSGGRVDNGDARVDQRDPNRKQLMVSLAPLSSGTYTVTFTTSSAEDGDKFTDSFRFTVQLAEEPTSAPLTENPDPSDD